MKENPWVWFITPFLDMHMIFICLRRLNKYPPDIYYSEDLREALENIVELVIFLTLGFIIGLFIQLEYPNLVYTLVILYGIGICLDIPRVTNIPIFPNALMTTSRLLNYSNLGFFVGIFTYLCLG